MHTFNKMTNKKTQFERKEKGVRPRKPEKETRWAKTCVDCFGSIKIIAGLER